MTTRTYSKEIANAIHHHLKDNDFKYQFDADRGVFNFLVGITGKAKTLIYHIYVSEHGFTSNARFPLGPSSSDEACMNTMARFLHRVNYALRNGNFELDMDDGEINYKVHCSCRGLVAPSDEMIAESITCPNAMFDKYEAGIMGILFSGMSDQEALDRCENGKGSMLSALEELKERLEARLHSDHEDDDDEDDDSSAIDAFLRMLEEKAAAEPDDADIFDADSLDV